MKILAYGAKEKINSLIRLLGEAESSAEVIRIVNVDGILAIDTLNYAEIRYVFIDASFNDSMTAFKYIQNIRRVPVVILIGKDDLRWDEFFGANGYLDLTNKSELNVARLKAMLRRLHYPENLAATGTSQ